MTVGKDTVDGSTLRRIDDRGRIGLKDIARHTHYLVTVSGNGTIVLAPAAIVAASKVETYNSTCAA